MRDDNRFKLKLADGCRSPPHAPFQATVAFLFAGLNRSLDAQKKKKKNNNMDALIILHHRQFECPDKRNEEEGPESLNCLIENARTVCRAHPPPRLLFRVAR